MVEFWKVGSLQLIVTATIWKALSKLTFFIIFWKTHFFSGKLGEISFYTFCFMQDVFLFVWVTIPDQSRRSKIQNIWKVVGEDYFWNRFEGPGLRVHISRDPYWLYVLTNSLAESFTFASNTTQFFMKIWRLLGYKQSAVCSVLNGTARADVVML